MEFPQLTLRDLFWLALVCALAVGWWVDRSDASKALYIEPIETGLPCDLKLWEDLVARTNQGGEFPP